jgi:hypothetical protein
MLGHSSQIWELLTQACTCRNRGGFLLKRLELRIVIEAHSCITNWYRIASLFRWQMLRRCNLYGAWRRREVRIVITGPFAPCCRPRHKWNCAPVINATSWGHLVCDLLKLLLAHPKALGDLLRSHCFYRMVLVLWLLRVLRSKAQRT